MKTNQNNSQNIFTKITKVTLVIYCLICVALFIIFITLSAIWNNYTFLWGFLLCLGPGILYILISVLLPFEKIVWKGSSKGVIAWFVIGYIFKYLLIIGIPIVGIFFQTIFNKWAMLATTLVGPVIVIITKIIIANKVSKNNKSVEEKPKNSIKF